jgi:hypothetical protein
MTIDKLRSLKSLIPIMEAFIDISDEKNIELGFSFTTNDAATIKGVCSGTSCHIDLKHAEKKDGIKTGIFHTHPNVTKMKYRTTPIGGGFSCGDILEQIDFKDHYGCVGTSEKIICGEIKSPLSLPLDISNILENCVSLQGIIRQKREYKNYKESLEEENDLKSLNDLQKSADNRLRHYMKFDELKARNKE